ncbi:hypothetical protein [Cupriavidus alkaliphilus]|nr:hypothetical protein [Cupriavidus alkaliphilus]MBB3014070.1 hypothetical protein [Cupriavidus alkaliphilus]
MSKMYIGAIRDDALFVAAQQYVGPACAHPRMWSIPDSRNKIGEP